MSKLGIGVFEEKHAARWSSEDDIRQAASAVAREFGKDRIFT